VGLFDSFIGNGKSTSAGSGTSQPQVDKSIMIKTLQHAAAHMGITVTDVEINSLLAGRSVYMKPEDQAAWNKEIEKRFEAEKLLRVEEFKKLPASMRQYILDPITWTRAIEQINVLSAPKSQEEIQFENLYRKHEAFAEVAHDIINGRAHGTSHGMLSPSMLSMMRSHHRRATEQTLFTIDGPTQYATIHLNEDCVSLKQLQDAHAEQCIADGITGDLNK